MSDYDDLLKLAQKVIDAEPDGRSIEEWAETLAADLVAAGETECEHEWVDARNRFVQSGELCIKCYAMKAGNSDEH